jgi:predicted phage-related endonuclease
MNEKLQKIIDIKSKIELLEAEMKNLQEEVKDEIKDKVSYGGYVFSKRSKTTYTIKKEVDVSVLAKEYPELATVKIDAKELYKCAENPDSLVDTKVSEYIEMRADKKNGLDIDI